MSITITLPTPSARKSMTQEEFDRLSAFVTANYGIKLPDHKKVMVEGRLQRRLKALNQESFGQYIDLVLGEEETEEMIEMVNAISTNKTDFFREPVHFDFLNDVVLPEHHSQVKSRDMKIWSAAASTGEEIYTIAMVIEEYFREQQASGFGYSILGTDISVEVLRKAISAVYHLARLGSMPLSLRQRYFLKSKEPKKQLVRVKPELRSKTKFGRLNLMDDAYPVDECFDVIFCRNVLIYFDRPTQAMVVKKLSEKLAPGGYLFLGHSESLFGKNADLVQIKPTIYRKPL